VRKPSGALPDHATDPLVAGAPRPSIETDDMLALTGKVALIINYHAFGHDDILDGATVPSISSRTNAAN
jgi:hypothetical protein